jgi:hypothetical protein
MEPKRYASRRTGTVGVINCPIKVKSGFFLLRVKILRLLNARERL